MRSLSSERIGCYSTVKCFASDLDQLRSAREDIKEILKTNFCHPILVSCFDYRLFVADDEFSFEIVSLRELVYTCEEILELICS